MMSAAMLIARLVIIDHAPGRPAAAARTGPIDVRENGRVNKKGSADQRDLLENL